MARSVSGERKRRLVRSLYYDCAERFRLRRLLAWDHGTINSWLSEETAVLFRPEHMQRLVRRGLSSDAVEYVRSFAPPMRQPRSVRFLLKFMRFVSRVVDTEDATSFEYDPYNPVQIALYGRANPGAIKLAEIVSSLRSEQASSRGYRGLQKKSLVRMPADALARSFLSKKRMHSSGQGTGLPLESLTMTQLAALIVDAKNDPLKQDRTEEIAIRSLATAVHSGIKCFFNLFAEKAQLLGDPEVQNNLRMTKGLLSKMT